MNNVKVGLRYTILMIFNLEIIVCLFSCLGESRISGGIVLVGNDIASETNINLIISILKNFLENIIYHNSFVLINIKKTSSRKQ